MIIRPVKLTVKVVRILGESQNCDGPVDSSFLFFIFTSHLSDLGAIVVYWRNYTPGVIFITSHQGSSRGLELKDLDNMILHLCCGDEI